MTKWVSVESEIKPYFRRKKNRPVIVTDGTNVSIAWYDHNLKTYLQDVSFKDITDAVTFWQYLPSPYPFPEKKNIEKLSENNNQT